MFDEKIFRKGVNETEKSFDLIYYFKIRSHLTPFDPTNYTLIYVTLPHHLVPFIYVVEKRR